MTDKSDKGRGDVVNIFTGIKWNPEAAFWPREVVPLAPLPLSGGLGSATQGRGCGSHSARANLLDFGLGSAARGRCKPLIPSEARAAAIDLTWREREEEEDGRNAERLEAWRIKARVLEVQIAAFSPDYREERRAEGKPLWPWDKGGGGGNG